VSTDIHPRRFERNLVIDITGSESVFVTPFSATGAPETTAHRSASNIVFWSVEIKSELIIIGL
jgi:hypothetical protein